MVEKMYVSYKIMCMKGKPEVEACKSIIQCFMGTLAKWSETESSPALIGKMEKETLEDENGNIIFIEDRFAQNNMIGALTTMILEHWWGIEQKNSKQTLNHHDEHEIQKNVALWWIS